MPSSGPVNGDRTRFHQMWVFQRPPSLGRERGGLRSRLTKGVFRIRRYPTTFGRAPYLGSWSVESWLDSIKHHLLPTGVGRDAPPGRAAEPPCMDRLGPLEAAGACELAVTPARSARPSPRLVRDKAASTASVGPVIRGCEAMAGLVAAYVENDSYL